MRVDINKSSLIKELYKNGCSAREIAEKFKLSSGCIYYFLRKNNIPRRSPKENNFLQFSKKPSTFKIKNNLTPKEIKLRIAGIMLYWAEGSNWLGEGIVDFANSKPEMIKTFLAFLRQICGIDERKLRAYLYCFSNQNVLQLINFWSKETKIPKEQFTKPYIRKIFNKNRRSKMVSGLLHVRYNDKKLLLLIQNWIREFSNSI